MFVLNTNNSLDNLKRDNLNKQGKCFLNAGPTLMYWTLVTIANLIQDIKCYSNHKCNKNYTKCNDKHKCDKHLHLYYICGGYYIWCYRSFLTNDCCTEIKI